MCVVLARRGWESIVWSLGKLESDTRLRVFHYIHTNLPWTSIMSRTHIHLQYMRVHAVVWRNCRIDT